MKQLDYRLTPSLAPILNLTNELCRELTYCELAGIEIDTEELDRLEAWVDEKRNALIKQLEEIAREVMGDTPINLNSPDQLGQILFSRRVNDKKVWSETFGLDGKYVYKSKPAVFRKLVQQNTTVIARTKAVRCGDCHGSGRIKRVKKDGSEWKNHPKCRACGGCGVLYQDTGKVAGLKLIPKDESDLSMTGFATSKEKMEEYAKRAKTPEAREFIEAMVQYSALSTYRATFIGGIRRSLRGGTRAYTNFMQHITKTGRLSSTNPNYHNQPRGGTFPIRRVVISRFSGGKILKADYSTLEFRVAAELAGDTVALKELEAGVDLHSRTAETLTNAGQETGRQEAKAHTFKPLFGGLSGTDAEVTYYKYFLNHYSAIREWHERLCDEALTKGYITSPSGREYAFPYARRFPSGGVAGATKIKNYEVQGFATADIVPIAFIETSKDLRARGLQSMLINEVHDELVVDTHPDEIEEVAKIVKFHMTNMKEYLKLYFYYDLGIDLPIEISIGDNWLDQKEFAI